MTATSPRDAAADLAALIGFLPQRFEARVPLETLEDYPRNAKDHDIGGITESMRRNGVYGVLYVQESTRRILAGHGRKATLLANGVTVMDCIFIDCDDRTARRINLADNRLAQLGGYRQDILGEVLAELRQEDDLAGTGYDTEDVDAILADLNGGSGSGAEGEKEPEPPRVTLADRFGVPPFSVLDARQGYWQARKRAWLALGIQSEVGRGNNLLKMSDTVLQPDPTKRAAAKKEGTLGAIASNQATLLSPEYRKRLAGDKTRAIGTQEWVKDKGLSGAAGNFTGTSIFDPVLCELAYRWFAPPGGSVRGVVAALLGRRYVGIDLRPEQIAANRQQATDIVAPRVGEQHPPQWIVGDSRDAAELLTAGEEAPLADGRLADFVFTCPPYAFLERYSDDPRDLSTLGYGEFLESYRRIIRLAASLLAPDRFACVVVGDLRDPKTGAYLGFVLDTINAFRDAGCALYNDAVLVTAVGSMPIRAARAFEGARKLGKAHQNVLVFIKGDFKRAVAAIGSVEFGEVPTLDGSEAEGGERPAAALLEPDEPGDGDALEDDAARETAGGDGESLGPGVLELRAPA